MKKTILAGASIIALGVASPAFAQSTSTVTQTGTGNQADVTQENANTSDINQVGDNNDADVVQNGIDTTGNDSDIDQTATGSNTASVTQGAGSNGSFADVLQDGTSDNNLALVNQFSTQVSTAEIIQTDALNGFAEVNQGGGNGLNNFAAVVQGDSSLVGGTVSGSDNANAITRQEGDDNVILGIQTGTDQILLVEQIGVGSGNDATVTQGSFGGGTSNAFILQIGDGDSAEIAQNSDTNDADIGQANGSGNFALIDQGFVGGAGVGGDNNIGITVQDGSDNFSAIEQNGTTAGNNNLADVLQDGDDNTSFVIQDGTDLTAIVNQLSDANFSSVTQGGTGNTVNVNQ